MSNYIIYLYFDLCKVYKIGQHNCVVYYLISAVPCKFNYNIVKLRTIHNIHYDMCFPYNAQPTLVNFSQGAAKFDF